jgi:hypothetical protein
MERARAKARVAVLRVSWPTPPACTPPSPYMGILTIGPPEFDMELA